MIYFQQKDPEKSIGSALGEALAALAEGKASHLVESHRQKNTEEGLVGAGYSREKARQLARFDPQILKEIIKDKVRKPNAESDEEFLRAAAQQYGGIYGHGQQQNQQQGTVQQPNIQRNDHPNFGQKDTLDSILAQLQASPYSQMLGGQQNQLGQQQQDPLKDLQLRKNNDLMQRLQQAQQQGQPNPQQQQQEQQQPAERKIDFSKLTPEQAIKLLEYQKKKEAVELSPAQQKIKTELETTGTTLIGSYNNVKKMQELIKDGAQFGVYPQVASIFGNNALQAATNPATSIFDQTSQEYLTNVTQNLKGRILAGQQKALQNAKPGINKSKEVNESALKDAEKILSHRIKQFAKDHPGIIDEAKLPEIFGNKNDSSNGKFTPAQIKEAHKELPPAKNFEEDDAWQTKNGTVFEIRNGRWVLSKE